MKLRKILVEMIKKQTEEKLNATQFKSFLSSIEELRKEMKTVSRRAFNIELLAAKKELNIHPWRWR